MKSLLLFITLALTGSAFSQDYAYLEDVKLKKEADFAKNGENLIKATDFLISAPMDESDFNRKCCDRFILKYAEGSPISVTLNGYLLKLTEGNTEFLVMYMGLYMKSVLQAKGEKDAYHENAAITSLYEYAKNGNNTVVNDAVKSLIEAGDAGTIDKWISAQK